MFDSGRQPDPVPMDMSRYMVYGLGKNRNNKKELAVMKRKQISKRRKRRFLFNRS